MYSIIALILLKAEVEKTEHHLVVVYNPYIKEDPRKNGEMWSKSYLNNKKKNKKILELLNEQYDPSVLQFISDTTNNAYVYDIRDVL